TNRRRSVIAISGVIYERIPKFDAGCQRLVDKKPLAASPVLPAQLFRFRRGVSQTRPPTLPAVSYADNI
ncbi:MAG: hypothetical protein M3384_06190, partial [Acidobacteriota bacterium]|nr:hypothetical protein [Acidobacteriota bacterium]